MANITNLSKLIFKHRFINIVHINPYIIYTQHSFFRDYAVNPIIKTDFFKKNESIILSTDNWYWNDNKYRPGQLKLILDGYNNFIIDYPKTKVIFLCPDKDTYEGYSSKNIQCLLFNRNSLLDPNDYFIYDKEKIIYDAIYNANLYKYKRHELIKDIDNIGLIYYLRNDNNKIFYIRDDEILYGKKLESELSKLNNITLINKLNGNYEYLSKKQICKHYGQTKCGLILSDIEGICLASMEYLLSGLIVISTENKGGRDYFLTDESFAITDVKDNKEAIEIEIEKVKSVNIDRHIIRDKTIDKMNEHNTKFLQNFNKSLSEEIDNSLISNMILAQKNYKI